MTYWPSLVNWILPSSSSSSSSSEFYDKNDEEFETNNQSPNNIIEDVVSSDQLLDIDSVVSPDDDKDYDPPSKRHCSEGNDKTRAISQKRVWTQEEEVVLLHGFLDYTSQRRKMQQNTNQHRDQMSSFFDRHVDAELKERFSKNQIVDKLRRSKRKYRNAMAKNSHFRFKNSHEKATFEICRGIWKNSNNNNGGGSSNKMTRRLLSTVVDESNNVTPNTRSQTRAGLLKKNVSTTSVDDDHENSSDTMGLIMDLGLNNYPIIELIKFGDLDNHGDEKWKEEKIMEMEVYLKRLELVQDKVKAALYKLRTKLD